jgi:glutamate synthase domain-containing protein 2
MHVALCVGMHVRQGCLQTCTCALVPHAYCQVCMHVRRVNVRGMMQRACSPSPHACARRDAARMAHAGEHHSNNQVMAKLLQKAVGLGGSAGDDMIYSDYMKHFENAPTATLRDVLELTSDRDPIDLAQVEPTEAIMARFCTGGMSLGAISRETHETIAIAMNRCATQFYFICFCVSVCSASFRAQ